jgi:hypothetical protein
MADSPSRTDSFPFEILQGIRPIAATQVPYEIAAGITLAAVAIPEVMGYTKISGTPVITVHLDTWSLRRIQRRQRFWPPDW